MNYITVKNQINEIVVNIVKERYNVVIEKIEIEMPAEIKNGHFSTNVALKNCKILGLNPRELGQSIVDDISINDPIAKVEIAGPGFINFYLTDEFFKSIVTNINTYGVYIEQVEKPEKINLEFVSANPTGDLHLGHARGATYGDAVGRLLRKIGHEVSNEYYINDAGAQMNNLGKSIKHFYELLCGIDSEFPDDGYAGQEIKAIAKNIYDEHENKKLDEEITWFTELGYEINIAEIKRILCELNVEFDVWSSEKYYHENGLVKASLDVLREAGDIYEEDGAVWLNTSKYGDDKNRVLEKSDGSHTYFTSDIAYHIDKYDRGFNRLINVWGGDHHGYVKRIKCAMESLNHKDSIEILLIQMINIVRGNEIVKMSKRAGTSVTIKDMLKEIDSDVMRYFFVMRSPDTQLDFDIELAQKQSSENPVFYIQYAHARICSLIKKANEQGVMLTNNISSINEDEIKIIDQLARYEMVVIEAANKRLPHILCNYLYEVATVYHHYYNAYKVFSDNDNEINDKINIGMSIKQILADGLSTLGIDAIETM